MENILESAARQFNSVDNIVDFQRRLEEFTNFQGHCIKLLEEEMAENKDTAAHIKSLLDLTPREDSNVIDDIMHGAVDVSPEHALSLAAFVSGLNDAM